MDLPQSATLIESEGIYRDITRYHFTYNSSGLISQIDEFHHLVINRDSVRNTGASSTYFFYNNTEVEVVEKSDSGLVLRHSVFRFKPGSDYTEPVSFREVLNPGNTDSIEFTYSLGFIHKKDFYKSGKIQNTKYCDVKIPDLYPGRFSPGNYNHHVVYYNMFSNFYQYSGFSYTDGYNPSNRLGLLNLKNYVIPFFKPSGNVLQKIKPQDNEILYKVSGNRIVSFVYKPQNAYYDALPTYEAIFWY